MNCKHCGKQVKKEVKIGIGKCSDGSSFVDSFCSQKCIDERIEKNENLTLTEVITTSLYQISDKTVNDMQHNNDIIEEN